MRGPRGILRLLSRSLGNCRIPLSETRLFSKPLRMDPFRRCQVACALGCRVVLPQFTLQRFLLQMLVVG